ncbi:MAG: HAD family phosphatase [Treponema sp.]|jgi:HAD superfamily hydrolase (TIGR01509 family)|nr:HAD family phosphatase [Treponema sp.]
MRCLLELPGQYKAAIFDLDGTLVDSMHVWDRICRDWLAGKGIHADDALEREIAAMTLSQSAGYVIRRYAVPLSPAEIQAEWDAIVVRRYRQDVPLKEGAAELVKTLAARGMKLGIATSCFPAACEAVLARHGIQDYFSVICYTDQLMRDKTFPDVYRACARRLGADPKDCVVFEDFPAAASGVKAAGMGLVAVYDESASPQWESFKRQADAAAVSFREFLGSIPFIRP